MSDDRKTTSGPRAADEARISRTTGTGSDHERRGADPDASDLRDPDDVWADAETTPPPSGETTGAPGRVADPGDLGKANPQPWSTETQADAVARQTERREEPRAPEKPKR